MHLLPPTIVFVSIMVSTLSYASAHKLPQTHQGTYRFVGGTVEKQQLNKAIESIAKKVNFFFRSRARKGLKKRFNIPQTLTLKQDKKGLFWVQRPGQSKQRKSSLNGTPLSFRTPKGKMAHLSRRYRADVITEKVKISGKQSGRTSYYRFSNQGKTMQLQVRIYIHRLKATLKYKLTYRK